MALFYLAYRYNILFVTDSQIDTKGLIYPRALQQLLTGVYIGEICLIGLFGIAATPGPLICMVIFLIFTILYHFSLNSALDPLLYSLPKSLEAEEESLVGALEAGTHNGSEDIKEKNSGEVSTSTPNAPVKKPNMFSKFFAPHIYSDYATLRQLVPHTLLDVNNMYEDAIAENAYYPPSVTAELPLLWIPKDEAGISAQEMQHTGKILPITDEGVTLDGKNKLLWDAEGARPPLWTPKVYY
jgi:calcium permeable stress-gated cation channel